MITLIYVQACFLGLSPWRPWLQRALALESCHWPETPVTSGLNSCQHFSLYSHIFDWGSQCVASSWVEWSNLMLMQFSNDWGGLSWRWAMYINVCVYIYIYRDVCTNLNNLEHQFSMHAGKSIEGSVTLSWGRHGGLGESPGSRTWVGHGAFSQSRIPEPAQSTGLSMFLNVVQKKP